MKKTKKILLAVLLLLCSTFLLTACYSKDHCSGYRWRYQYDGGRFDVWQFQHVKRWRQFTGELVIEDGVYYEKDGGHYYVAYCEDDEAEIKIKSVVNKRPVTSIGEYAFENCDNLTSIEIPDSVTSIGYGAFRDCSYLTSVYITDIAAWCNISFGNYAANPLSYAENLYLNNQLVTDLVIPDSVTSIGWAFRNCDSLTSVVIPDSVTSIDDYAFKNCGNLTTVTIGSAVSSIGKDAFAGCENLGIVNVKDIASWCNIQFDNSMSNPLSFARDIYVNNQLVLNLVIPDGVEKIENYAFNNCNALTGLSLPNSLTTIGDNAFYNCDNLTSVKMSNAITSIGKDAFSDCENLIYNEYGNGCYFGDDTRTYSALMKAKNTEITDVEISPETRFVYQSAFSNCKALEKVHISDLAAWCQIIFSDNLSHPCSTGADLYMDNEKIIDLVIPDTVSVIYEYAFFNCQSFKSVTIPNSVTKIYQYAFDGCKGLTQLTIPDSVVNIGFGAFGNCTSLENITLPFIGYQVNETENARWNVFGFIFGDGDYDGHMESEKTSHKTSSTTSYTSQSYNSAAAKWFYYQIPKTLKSVTVTSAKTIPYHAFYNCDLLESIYLPISIERIGVDAFANCSKATIYCERNNKFSDWDADWNDGCPVVWNCAQEEGVTEDGFQYRKLIDGKLYITGYEGTLSDITIPETIEGIAVAGIFERAFFNCDNLTSVTISNGIITVGNRAFYDCDNLTEVKIFGSVSRMEDFVFSDCDKLTIYCEATEQPSGWNENWNITNRPVVWGNVEGK